MKELGSKDFDINGEPRCEQLQEMKDQKLLEILLTEDAALSSVELTKELAVNHNTVLRHLMNMYMHWERFRRKGNGPHI